MSISRIMEAFAWVWSRCGCLSQFIWFRQARPEEEVAENRRGRPYATLTIRGKSALGLWAGRHLFATIGHDLVEHDVGTLWVVDEKPGLLSPLADREPVALVEEIDPWPGDFLVGGFDYPNVRTLGEAVAKYPQVLRFGEAGKVPRSVVGAPINESHGLPPH